MMMICKARFSVYLRAQCKVFISRTSQHRHLLTLEFIYIKFSTHNPKQIYIRIEIEIEGIGGILTIKKILEIKRQQLHQYTVVLAFLNTSVVTFAFRLSVWLDIAAKSKLFCVQKTSCRIKLFPQPFRRMGRLTVCSFVHC